MTAAVAVAQFQMIELSKLGESPLNPRKHFDEKKLSELADSVTAKGVLEPLLVRPVEMLSGGKGPVVKGYEVVAGARRYRAAVKAKLKEVPCLVKELTDSEALEVAILENVARADITAMEEGDGYRALLKMGHTVESLVEKTGRSRTVVFQRMKLAELQGEARALVLSGKMSASIGELIARLPTKEAQAEALQRLEDDYQYDGVENMPFREAKEILDENFVLHLKEATFDVKDAQLVPAAGACVACPKRTHAPDNKALFPDVKVDTCLDRPCWETKKVASFNALQAELEANGKRLIKEEKLFLPSYMSSTPNTLTPSAAEKFAKPTDKVIGEKTWKDLLGEAPPEVVVLDGEEKTHKLVDRKAALKLLQEKDPKAAKKLKDRPKKSSSSTDDWQARQREQNKKYEAERKAIEVVRVKLIASTTKMEAAIDALIEGWAADTYDWRWKLKSAGLPEGLKVDKLKPAQRVQLLAMEAYRHQASVKAHAKRVKLDVKELTKKALKAEKGTCFACSKPAPEKTLCSDCGGEED